MNHRAAPDNTGNSEKINDETIFQAPGAVTAPGAFGMCSWVYLWGKRFPLRRTPQLVAIFGRRNAV